MRILTAEETRAIDRATIEELGVPGPILMEHAASAVADAAAASLGAGGRICIVAGAGNNAGDGYAAARLLLSKGCEVRLVALVEAGKLRGDAATNATLWSRFGGGIEPFAPTCLDGLGPGDVVVDALLGTGLSRPPEGSFAAAIDAMNGAGVRGAAVVAVDLPSGLSADTGRCPGPSVRASRTVTLGALKRGLVLYPGAELAGEVEVAAIGWPPNALDALEPGLRLLREETIRGLLPERGADTHKGSFGHCLIVAGSEGKSGAAALASRGALVGGAGLATVATRAEVIPPILAHAMEVMAMALSGQGPLSLADAPALLEGLEGKHAALLGPGIPRGSETGALIARLLAEAGCPLVLDADALNAIADQTSCLDAAARAVVITPHPGEMGRLAGISTSEVQADRIGVAKRFAAAHRCVVILKGAGTVVADPDGEAAICPTGNAGMATAGAGDVLGGVVAALLAQGLPAPAAARAAVYVHGLAGDREILRRGRAGLVASDLLRGIGEVWASWDR